MPLSSDGYGLVLNSDRTDAALLINAIGLAAAMPHMSDIREMARRLQVKIALADPIIKPGNDKVCPNCQAVCCVNKFGCYDVGDVIYIALLGYLDEQSLPWSNNELAGLPCKYLLPTGCALLRQLRPFRCNWFFCTPIIEYMESGGKRAYRAFNRLFQEIITLRKEMLDEFSASALSLSGEDELRQPPYSYHISP
ncbi:MAG: hypothetical protein L7F77_02065 [Candidatus Magnetominusculus sp. LBB02]|nr:hypothetical protein [Candidatus Magnetominusculus sp. LBB02]